MARLGGAFGCGDHGATTGLGRNHRCSHGVRGLSYIREVIDHECCNEARREEHCLCQLSNACETLTASSLRGGEW